MKHLNKLFSILALFLLCSAAANATVWPVNVVSFEFQNSPATVTVGDTIQWNWGSGVHTTTSTAIPAGAAGWNSLINSGSQQFEYVVTLPGVYNYYCDLHPVLMTASFTAVGGPCTFTPEITPATVTLCPNSTDTLFASPAGGAYQWFEDGDEIVGATLPFLVIDNDDIGDEFEVEVTIDGCTDESEEVVIEGWSGLLPTVAQDGGWLVDGITHICAGDSMTLTFLLPYNTNIQWSNESGIITGATNAAYTVTESGLYTVSGAPEECPNYIVPLGQNIQIVEENPLVPTIMQMGDMLMAGPLGLSFQWYLNGEIISGATASTYTPTAAGNYTVMAVNANGCSGTSEAVVVLDVPCTFTPEVTPTGLVLCPNATDTIFASPAGGTYQWYHNGMPISGATNSFYVVNAFDDAGFNFQVEVTLNGCTDMSDSVLVDGWAFLPPFVMQSDNGVVDQNGITHICGGDTLTLTMMSPYTTNIQWYESGEPIPGANFANLFVTTSGSYTVSGAPEVCPDFNQTMNIAIQVEVNIPTVPIITLSNDTLYANPMVAAYTWYFNGNVMADENNYFIVPTQPGLYNASMTDINQCSGISGPFAFGLVDTCAWEPVISPNGNLTLCPNTFDTLTVAPGGGAYQWYKNGLPIAGAMNDFLIINSFADDASTFSVIAVLESCIDTSADVTVSTIVFEDILVTASGGWMDSSNVHHVCAGESFTLMLNDTYNSNIQWFNGDPVVNGNANVLNVTEGGTYTVLAAPSACPNYMQMLSPGVLVVFHDSVEAVITQSNDTLFAEPANGTNYQWFKNGNLVAGETNAWYVLNPDETGSFTVSLVDSNQCSTSSEPAVITGINDVANGGMNVYPNPVQSELTIAYNGSNALEYMIFDVTGKAVQEGTCERTIETASLATGAYLLLVKDGERNSKQVFVKE